MDSRNLHHNALVVRISANEVIELNTRWFQEFVRTRGAYLLFPLELDDNPQRLKAS